MVAGCLAFALPWCHSAVSVGAAAAVAVAVAMYGGEAESRSAHVPTWDGNPERWNDFAEEVALWSLGENLEVSYSLAARLVGRLTGSARKTARQMTAVQMHPDLSDAVVQNEDAAAWKARRNKVGIDNVMTRLRERLGVSKPVQKGERLETFFQTRRFHRKAGERITDWTIRFEEGLNRLEEVGVKLTDLQDVAGWFYLSRSNIGPERRERVISALPDEHYDIEKLKPLLTRFFSDMHLREKEKDHQQARDTPTLEEEVSEE